MAIEYVHSTTDGNLTIKWVDTGITNEIHVDDTITNLLVQDLINACRAAESSVAGFAFGTIANASGKAILGPGVAVGITVELLGTWRVYSKKVSGVFTVLGGNLVKGDGSSPFRPNNLIAYVNILSANATIVTTGGGSGGGFTSADRTKLDEIHTGDAPVIDGSLTFKTLLKKIAAVIFGDGVFSEPTPGTRVIEFKNQEGNTESTHTITPSGRVVS